MTYPTPKYLAIAALVAAASACTGGGGDGGSDTARNAAGNAFDVLVYSRTEGFRHASIEPGILAIEQLGSANNFNVTATEDPTAFTSENLAQFEVVLFLNTTLNVLDGAQETAFEDYIRGGGNYVGIHSAADTEHDWPFYGALVGAYFLAHPVANQPGTLRVEDTEHASTQTLPQPWSLPIEEYYSFSSNPRGDVRVLLSIDESTYMQEPNTSCDPSGPTFPQGYDGVMGDHPMAWCHRKFGGVAWYTALGHEPYLYRQTDFLTHIAGGILTAAGRLPSICSANLKPVDVPDYIPPQLEACENQVQ